MDFDPSTLIAGIVVSGIGFVLFSYGKRMSRAPQILIGLCMLVYPYFTSGALLVCGIGAALLLVLWGAVKLGY